MKVYLSTRERAYLRSCIQSRADAIKATARKEGWRASELAMQLADATELYQKLDDSAAAPTRKAGRR